MIEAGVPGYEISAWYMMFAPKKTPPEVLTRLNRAVDAAIEDPEFARQMAAQGIVLRRRQSEQAKTFLRREVDRWGKLIKAQNIKAE